MSRAALIFAVLLLSALAMGREGEDNRVGNGDFDGGEAGATKIPGWTEVDGLTTFFEIVPGRGRVLRIDTDVNLSEANVRWEEMALPPEARPAAKPKGQTRPPKYDTVGGTTGAKIYSDYIRVEPNMRYRLKADVRSDKPIVMIFVKGYAEFQGGFRKFDQCYKNVVEVTDEWHTWERTFNPTIRSPKVTHIRVMPYAYWPSGNAWIDNIEVTRIGEERVSGGATAKSVLANGVFEKVGSQWKFEGGASRVVRGGEGACGRVDGPGSIVSGPVPVDEDRPYVLRARVLPKGGALVVTIQGVVKLSGETYVMFTKEETVPAESGDWGEIEVRFHPTEDTPQVSAIRIRFAMRGETGSALVDDVAVEPVAEESEER